MTTLKTGYYQADTANGVSYIGDILENSEQDVLPAGLFAESLEDLEDGEIIVAFFDMETFGILENIEKHYSIN